MRLRGAKPNTLPADGNLLDANRTENYFNVELLLVTAIFCLAAPTAAGQVKTDAATPTRQDSTFVFSADIHVGFNGTDDTHGFFDFANGASDGSLNASLLYIADETAAGSPINGSFSQQQDGCIANGIFPPLPALKDVCNQIQQVRKINALHGNTWPATSFVDGMGHNRTLQSQGAIPTPLGHVIGGDLTDCGGGNSGAASCINYTDGGNNTQQLAGFQAIYDKFVPKTISFNSLPFLRGLSGADAATPLQIEIFPGLGNHDIDNPGIGGKMHDWLQTHLVNLVARDSSGASNWNINQTTTAYSWNWGNLHMVNVGVYPGSQNDYTGGNNYNWDPSDDAFLLNDLKNNAFDGRPVVIASHFGFDDYSLKANWWNGLNHVCGLADLWTELNKFNVVGYYHGHVHGFRPFDITPSIQYAYKYPNGSSTEGAPTKAPRPKISYDVFLPGAAYYQSLAVTRITDSRMDVAMATSGADFVDGHNQTIDFAPTGSFTKILTPAPAVVGAPWSDNALETQILGFTAGDQSYVIGAEAAGIYLIRSINAATGAPTFLSGGQFSSPVTSMASYGAEDGTHIIVSGSNGIVDYRFTQNNLVHNWTVSISGGSIMTFAKGAQNYLVVDAHSAPFPSQQQETLTIYQINSNGLAAVGAPFTQAVPVLSNTPQLQTYQMPQANQLGMIEFDPDNGTAIFYTLNLNGFSIVENNKEQWTAGRMRILNFPYGVVQILLTTPSFIMVQPSDYAPYIGSSPGSAEYCPASPHYWQTEQSLPAPTFAVPAANPDSPVYVLSMIDGTYGTDVSWRGLPLFMPYVDVPASPASSSERRPPPPPQTIDSFVTSGVDGNLLLSSYHASGLLTRMNFSQPVGVNVTFSYVGPSIAITVNGTPVTAGTTISLIPGRTYTLSAPASFSIGPGYLFSNPSWSSNVQSDNTFTVPGTDTIVSLNYQQQVQVTTVANPPAGGTISGGGWIPFGNVTSFQAAPSAGYTFAGFTGYGDTSTDPFTFKVTSPGTLTANFSTGGGPSLSVTTQGARTDGPHTGQRTVPLEIVNGNASGIGHVSVTSIDGIQVLTGTGTVLLAGGIPASIGNMPPNGNSTFNVIMNWPATAARVRFVVHFQGNAGAYTGSSTLTLNR